MSSQLGYRLSAGGRLTTMLQVIQHGLCDERIQSFAALRRRRSSCLAMPRERPTRCPEADAAALGPDRSHSPLAVMRKRCSLRRRAAKITKPWLLVKTRRQTSGLRAAAKIQPCAPASSILIGYVASRPTMRASRCPASLRNVGVNPRGLSIQ